MSNSLDKVHEVVELLKTTPLPQGTRALHNEETREYGTKGYCCLGVMCRAVGYTDKDLGTMTLPNGEMIEAIAERYGLDLYTEVSAPAGAEDIDGATSLMNALAYLNDSGHSFAAIADYIDGLRAHLEGDA